MSKEVKCSNCEFYCRNEEWEDEYDETEFCDREVLKVWHECTWKNDQWDDEWHTDEPCKDYVERYDYEWG